MNIKINVSQDGLGMLYLRPVKQSYVDQIINYLKEFNIDSDGSVLIQNDYEVESFLDDCNAGDWIENEGYILDSFQTKREAIEWCKQYGKPIEAETMNGEKITSYL